MVARRHSIIHAHVPWTMNLLTCISVMVLLCIALPYAHVSSMKNISTIHTANAHSPDLTHLLLFPTRTPSSRVRKRVFRCVQEDNSIEALIMNTRPVRSARQENSKFSQLLLRLHAQAQQTLLCLPVCGHRPSLEVPEVPKVPAPRVLHGVLTTSARM